MAPLRRLGISLAVLAATLSSAAHADVAYLQIPGVPGPSTAPQHHGWFEVAEDSVALVPGKLGADGRAVASRCTATIRAELGSAGAELAELVGSKIGNVRLERVGGNHAAVYRAVLRNAVLTQEMALFGGGVASDLLSLRFESIDVTTYQLKPDGTLGSGVQGSFNCLYAP